MEAKTRASFVQGHILLSLTFIALPFVSTGAIACSITGEKPTDEQLFAKANSVFVAHVYRTEEKSFQPTDSKESIAAVEADFCVIEVLKGKPPADNKVKDFVFGPGNCSLGLLAGFDYLFFVPNGPDNLVLWPTGSRALFNLKGTEVVKTLSNFRRLRKDAPE